MNHKAHRYYPVLLMLVLIMISSILPSPTRAAVERELDIDNNLTEFDDGSFQITASAQFPSTTPIGNDQVGAVQLAPIADLKDMTASTDLPYGRTDAAVVALGSHIFVIGGIGPIAGDSSLTSLRSTVYVSQVDRATGGLSQWSTGLELPALKHSDTYPDDLISERTRSAVAAFATGPESGYIYIIGGSTNLDISSYSVLRGTVINGQITSWNESDPMPNVPEDEIQGSIGIESAAASVVTLPDGSMYLYLVGGLRRYFQGTVIQQEPSTKIYYAQINPANGNFIDNAWKSIAFDLPDGGLWNTALLGGVFEDTNGQKTNAALYILGGQSDESTYSSVVYRATINNDGSLGYLASGAGSNASLGEPRTGHAAVQYRGAIYSMGGAVNGLIDPTRSVLGSYIQSNGSLPEIGGQGSATYFITNQGLPEPRIGHGAVIVPSPATNPTGAWIYAIGGSNGTGPQSTIYKTRIGDTTITNVRYPIDGWYISKPLLIPLKNANLKKVYWQTELSGGANIKIQYRVSADTDCVLLASRSEATAPWQDTNMTSVTGYNEFPITPLPANCFQYRAQLTPGGGILANQTPYLMRLGIIVEVPGATDLTVTSFGFRNDSNNTPVGLQITLRNENIYTPGEPTLAADYVPGATGQGTGSFFVDIFIYPPGAIVPPLTDHKPPTTSTAYARATIDVLKKELQAGDANNNPVQVGGAYTFTIPADRQIWNYDHTQTVTLQQLFPAAGVYTVVVVVDGDNNIKETPEDAGKSEDNNVFSTQVTIVNVPVEPSNPTIYLPVIAN